MAHGAPLHCSGAAPPAVVKPCRVRGPNFGPPVRVVSFATGRQLQYSWQLLHMLLCCCQQPVGDQQLVASCYSQVALHCPRVRR